MYKAYLLLSLLYVYRFYVYCQYMIVMFYDDYLFMLMAYLFKVCEHGFIILNVVVVISQFYVGCSCCFLFVVMFD